MTPLFDVVDLGRMPYSDAYALQERHLDEVLLAREHGRSESAGRLLLVEHDPPVITVTRRPGARSHLLASPDQLARAGIELRETDRGGDITYHGPGQLVAYPILDLNLLRLRLHDYIRLLEASVIDVCARFGVPARRDPGATGVWVCRPGVDHLISPAAAHASDPSSPCAPPDAAPASKICAIGVRVRRWISMHGLALNVSTNLDHFQLIVPCGLAGRGVSSLRHELGDAAPRLSDVKPALSAALDACLRRHAGSPAPA